MAGDAPQDAGAGDGGRGPAPGLDESLAAINAARREALDASRGTLRALRRLASADFALARSAFGRALAWAGAATVFGASAWLFVTGTLIALMQRMGLSWLQSLAVAALMSLVAAGFAAWRVSRYFDLMGMHATRRQLSRLGLFDEDGAGDDDDDEPPPGPGADAARPAAAAAARPTGAGPGGG
ncbi:phage holin family protein [Luteimonas wenzhouensis]|uniref:Phage holin family protein n=1 Tax=Luteimonas wenzhouensis TaxID=2599615 RepID=A0A5C5U127_9GAMM|nr:phage holin family protein [Luteimonas wenzhouensis]TWT19656.1 phage holin family protein [Luteimonas wenzhouensis]